jgi:hypothetical protein
VSGHPDWHIVVGLILTLAGNAITAGSLLYDLRHGGRELAPSSMTLAL